MESRSLLKNLEAKRRTNIIIAIQKEMFHDHFFLDKMQKVELKPLNPRQMLEAYLKRFKTTAPFTEDALLALAQMSRGIFRRFLKYITLALDHWQTQPEPRQPINPTTVRTAVTREQLAEDMEIELRELFPKQADLRLQTIQILTHLQTTGPKLQSQLAKELEMKPYAVSRLLTRLEHHRHITRQRTGSDKMVSLTNKQPEPSTDPRHTPSLLPN